MQCSKCGSDRVIPQAQVLDQGQGSDQTLQAYVSANPDALIFKANEYATLYARICAECGAVEFFTHEAGRLYEAYVRSQPAPEPGK